MESSRHGQFLIACRYVPYDQWFLTHIHKSWKIKHLKQSIIAKVLNLPFDRRHLVQGAINARPPSPITFAPDDSTRPISPIEFASSHASRRRDGLTARRVVPEDDSDRGGSKDAQLEDAHIQGNAGRRAAVPSVSPSASPTTSSAVRPGHPVPSGTVTLPGSQEEKDQIFTDAFTLIRFTTGQVLEDNFLVSWYDLGPHELVELHASSPPTAFSFAIVFRQLLVNGGTIDVDLSSNSLSNSDRASALKIPHQGHTLSSSLDLRSVADQSSSKHSSALLAMNDTIGTKLSLTLCNPPILTYLPRHDPVAYAQPYWEGWIRVLRVVVRSDVDAASALRSSETGMRTKEGLGPGVSPEDGRSEKRYKTKKEWRERWAVIRDGCLNLCRDRDDMTPTHRFPLSALTNMTGAEYLATHVHKDRRYNQSDSQPGKPDNSGKLIRPSSSRLTASAKSGTKSTSVLHARPPSSRPDPDVEIKKTAFSPITISPEDLDLPSQPPTPSTLSPSIHPMNSLPDDVETLASTIFSGRNSTEALTGINHGLSRRQRDKFDRERAALRELERESERKSKEENIRMKKEVESIMRWDDLGIFSKSKGKEKDKRRRMDPTDHKDRGERVRKAFDYPASSSSRHPFIGAGDKVKDKKDRERNRQRDRGADRHQERNRGKDFIPQREHSLHGQGHSDRWYIPSSREDAQLAGMWIVCARFRSVNKAVDLDMDTSTAPGRVNGARFTSTGPSLASNSQVYAIGEAEDDESKDENHQDREWKRFEQEQKEAELRSRPIISSDVPSTVQLVLASRKSSLPSLGLGLTMLNTGSHGSGSSSSLFGGIFGGKDKEKDGLDKRRERDQKGAKGKDRETGDKVQEHSNDDFSDTPALRSSPTRDDSNGDSNLGPSQLRVQIQVEAKSDPAKDTLTIDTSAASNSDPEAYLGLSSPSFAPNTDSDVDDIVQEHRKRQTHGTSNKQATQQRILRRSEGKAIEGEKGEWVVLDLGTDVAYNSFLRILHRDFLPPIQTSFIDGSEPKVPDVDGPESMPTYLSSPHQPYIATSQPRSRNIPLALPYPEWRNETLHRARSEGMLEWGRPLELTLHDWGRQIENMSPEFRKQRIRDEQWRKQLRMGFIHGDASKHAIQHDTKAEIDADPPDGQSQSSTLVYTDDGSHQQTLEDEATMKDINDDNHISSFESIVFDDSEDESEDESACWWKDIPRQSLLKEKRSKQEKDLQTSPEVQHRVVDAVQSTPTSPGISFSNPFSSSSLEASESSMASSTTPASEGRLQPSLSTTAVPSNFTSSNPACPTPVHASPRHSFRSTSLMSPSAAHNTFPKTVTKASRFPGPKTPQEERQRYLEQRRELEPRADAYMDPTTLPASKQDDDSGEGSAVEPPMHHHYYRRMPLSTRGMARPSQTLSSPSSEESLVSHYHSQPRRAQPRSSPPDETFESNIIHHQHTKSASLLHHSYSATDLSCSPSLRSTKASSPRPPRARTVTAPSSPRNFETPILTLAQIHQIESEIEAQIAASNQSVTGLSPPHEGIESKPAEPYVKPAAQYGPESGPTEEWTIGIRGQPRPSNDVGLGPRHTVVLDREDGSLSTKLSPSSGHNRARKRSHAAPTSSPSHSSTPHVHSPLLHKSSISAKAVLRRVRSGSSLQIPMGIHFEDVEENEF